MVKKRERDRESCHGNILKKGKQQLITTSTHSYDTYIHNGEGDRTPATKSQLVITCRYFWNPQRQETSPVLFLFIFLQPSVLKENVNVRGKHPAVTLSKILLDMWSLQDLSETICWLRYHRFLNGYVLQHVSVIPLIPVKSNKVGKMTFQLIYISTYYSTTICTCMQSTY